MVLLLRFCTARMTVVSGTILVQNKKIIMKICLQANILIGGKIKGFEVALECMHHRPVAVREDGDKAANETRPLSFREGDNLQLNK